MPDTDIKLPIHVTVNGQGIELKRLSSYDRAKLLKAKFQEDRRILIDTLKDAGITTGPDYFATVNQFDSYLRKGEEWVNYCNNAFTDYDIILASIMKSIPDKIEAEKLAQEVDINFEVKADICGLKLREPDPEPDPNSEEGIDPETGRPLVYGDSPDSSTTTSPETPTPSDSTSSTTGQG